MRRFEYVEGTSSKFWAAAVEGKTFVVVYGRIGTPGQRKDKAFPTEAAAQAEYQKKVAEKLREGYAEIGTHDAPPSAASADAKKAADESAGEKAGSAKPPRPPLPPRVRNTLQGASDAARVDAAVSALRALEGRLGGRSFRTAHAAQKARRALGALGGFDPAKSTAMAPVFDALMKSVIAPRGQKRLSLRLALALLAELDAAAFARALALWKSASASSPASAGVRALGALGDALGEPELALRLATLAADRPDRGAGSEAGWARRWKSLAPHFAAAAQEQGKSAAEFLRSIDAAADPHVARRLEKMAASG